MLEAKKWMIAIRVKTLLIPTIQMIASIAIASRFVEFIQWNIAFGALAVAILITIGTNLINDVIDFEKGGDKVRTNKVIPSGLLSKNVVKYAGYAAFIIACLLTLLLPVPGIVFALVFISAICGYCYTGGPFPISYLGLSEFFILFFYGGVCILTPFYVLTHQMNLQAILVAIQMGLLAILPAALNNCRDMYEDIKSHKKTLAVRFGPTFGQVEISALITLPFLLNIFWIRMQMPLVGFLSFLSFPLALNLIYKIWTTKPGIAYNDFFILSVILHFLFGLLLASSLFFGG